MRFAEKCGTFPEKSGITTSSSAVPPAHGPTSESSPTWAASRRSRTYQQRPLAWGIFSDCQTVTSESPSASAASRRHNLQQRPRADGTRLTHLRVTTSLCRFTEVLYLPATATGGAVLSRLRLGARRAASPAVTKARHLRSPPTDRSPIQDSRPGPAPVSLRHQPGPRATTFG